ncbi:MAG TPA: LytTR family DNA-binding domain-containing protein, partial [Bacteroidales bacterium]|nr:LytTR family DNA-binding domain-containing protein [Bacteroidales bacterium]
AFKISAVDYLLKPYKPSELVEAIQKATEIINHQIFLKKLEALLHNLYIPLNKQIVIHTTEAFFILEVSDIVRCMADDNYTHFIMDNGEEVVVSKPLKKYENLLKDFGFCRVHQSHLINLNKLVKFNKRGKSTVVLKNNDIIPVSKGMRSNIFDFLNSL